MYIHYNDILYRYIPSMEFMDDIIHDRYYPVTIHTSYRSYAIIHRATQTQGTIDIKCNSIKYNILFRGLFYNLGVSESTATSEFR